VLARDHPLDVGRVEHAVLERVAHESPHVGFGEPGKVADDLVERAALAFDLLPAAASSATPAPRRE
jgi:hypothetical protein